MFDTPRPLTWLALIAAFVLLPIGLALIGSVMPTSFSNSNEMSIQHSLGAVPTDMTQGRG